MWNFLISDGMPLLVAGVTVFGTAFANCVIQRFRDGSLQKFLAGALTAEISLAFDSYVDYEFPDDLMDRRFEHQINDVILFEPSLAVYQRNTDKLGIFHVNDTKKLIQLYIQIERLSRTVRLLDRCVREYKDAIRKSNNLPLNMKQNLPVPFENVQKTIKQIKSQKETAFQLRQDVLEILNKY